MASVDWRELSDRVLSGGEITRDEALGILNSSDDELLAVIDAAFRVRLKYFGRDVNLHVLCNAKSGLCGEDCAFCSQSSVADTDIVTYPIVSADKILEGAREAQGVGAAKYCTVISGRAPTRKDLDEICEALRAIKKEMNIHLCVSAGLLDMDQVNELKAAGADRINHNLETSRAHFAKICTTHTYDDRIQTVENGKAAGLEICCGGLIGMGETKEDRVDLALELGRLGVHSIPVNFLDPREGTPLSGRTRVSPSDCLRVLAMFRLVNPSTDIRAAGGREVSLGHMQPFALYLATSIFTQGYLTTGGQGHSADLEMISQAGFRVGQIEA